MFTLARVERALLTRGLPYAIRADVVVEMVRIGSEYGGWWVPLGTWSAESVCYCVGAGEDITFDLGLADRFGCRVWTIDPTPRAATWFEGRPTPNVVSFVPIGLTGTSGVKRFYAPADPSHVSHSINNLQHTTEYFEAECLTLGDLMGRLGHVRIDLLKLDVEGAEHDVVSWICANDVRPATLCVEFDQPSVLAVRRSIRWLRQVGYRVAKVEARNVTFVHCP